MAAASGSKQPRRRAGQGPLPCWLQVPGCRVHRQDDQSINSPSCPVCVLSFIQIYSPTLADGAIANISSCTRLTHLDLAHNDVSSVGVKQLGTPALGQLQHLDLRNNAQVEKWAVLSAAPHLSRLTGLNLMEISDVRARAFPRAAAAGRRGAASGHQAAAAAGATPGSTGRQAAAVAAAAAGGGGGSAAGLAAGAGGVRRPHADIWAALPDLEELWVEAENGFASRGSRGGRVVLSTL